MNAPRRLAFARARHPVAAAMRVVAAALAAIHPAPGARRSVFSGPRHACRVAPRERDRAIAPSAPALPRGCEDLH
jgi:hypothetical protein